ncbi:pyruvate kinase [Mycoplasma sp. Mirounga ES2805-ORL]|uniref:pyruvate kinase n=1 Tax=Mycoplasma sp. Mirounga ES2805-ORL TaxID=754514 RepID=UPI00197B846E|nr:pyruvate kinase [Mycoplasma sp. Mirounga ES2805-ORL]QSF13847.1 pyruvate kinase [Mycoplasma sp. Mirounga ES2805-ORL]
MQLLIEKRSKLIVTLGPASSDYDTLKKMVLAGATAIRANFSHGNRKEQLKKFDLARKVSKEFNVPISIILDTKGPEIRIGKMRDGAQEIKKEAIITLITDPNKFSSLEGTDKEIAVSYDMSKDVKPGDLILFDDGKLQALVLETKKNNVIIKTINQHKLITNKRINLPGVDFSLPFLSEKDKDDIAFGVKHGINYVAASFVNSAKNVRELRDYLNSIDGEHVKIISKIESDLGIKNIDEIIRETDALMIARGDLGLEINFYDVPVQEKFMIRKCREAGKPVIVATQMLDSMEHSPNPTRAEVTDVFYATELGADSTMLSGESATGLFPVKTVEVMSQINKRAENEFYNTAYYDDQLEQIRKNSDRNFDHSRVAYRVANRARYGEYRFTIVLSDTGRLLSEVAKFRPNTIIIGIINDEKLINSFGVTYGVWNSVDSKKLFKKIKRDFKYAKDALKPYNVEKGEKFLIVEQGNVLEMTV